MIRTVIRNLIELAALGAFLIFTHAAASGFAASILASRIGG